MYIVDVKKTSTPLGMVSTIAIQYPGEELERFETYNPINYDSIQFYSVKEALDCHKAFVCSIARIRPRRWRFMGLFGMGYYENWFKG